MGMVYQWKPGSRVKADAAEVGSLLGEIHERDGSITTGAVVDAGRDESSPIHDCFEWQDDLAAEKYRHEQARYIIRSIAFSVENEDGEPTIVRAVVEIRDSDTPFVPLQVALGDEVMRRKLINQALVDLAAFERKYRTLNELASVFDETRRVRQALLSV